jgi:hypothetical protein
MKLRNLVLAATLLTGCGPEPAQPHRYGGNYGPPPGGDRSGKACRDSPFKGKYLINAVNCGWTMSEPFQDDCTGVLEPFNRPHLNLNVTYTGSTLYSEERWREGEKIPENWILEFVNNPTRGQLDASIDDGWRIEKYLCYFSKDPELHGLVYESGLIEPRLENVYRVSDQTAYLGCGQDELKKRWYTECK